MSPAPTKARTAKSASVYSNDPIFYEPIRIEVRRAVGALTILPYPFVLASEYHVDRRAQANPSRSPVPSG